MHVSCFHHHVCYMTFHFRCLANVTARLSAHSTGDESDANFVEVRKLEHFNIVRGRSNVSQLLSHNFCVEYDRKAN